MANKPKAIVDSECNLYNLSDASLSISGIRSYPEFLSQGQSVMIVEDSVIVLHCLVDPPTLNLTWTRNGTLLVPDLPHIRMINSTTNDNSTHFMLTVHSFQSSDSGMYQCIVQDMGSRPMGAVWMLTGTAITI